MAHLTEKLHKPTIKKSEKCKVYSCFKGNIWGADLSDMQLISKVNKKICFLLCFDCSFKRQNRYYNHQCFSKHFK